MNYAIDNKSSFLLADATYLDFKLDFQQTFSNNDRIYEVRRCHITLESKFIVYLNVSEILFLQLISDNCII